LVSSYIIRLGFDSVNNLIAQREQVPTRKDRSAPLIKFNNLQA